MPTFFSHSELSSCIPTYPTCLINKTHLNRVESVQEKGPLLLVLAVNGSDEEERIVAFRGSLRGGGTRFPVSLGDFLCQLSSLRRLPHDIFSSKL